MIAIAYHSHMSNAPLPPQSIAAYTYSCASPAFVKAHRAARLLFMNDWTALKATVMELVHLARESPLLFYGFRLVQCPCEPVVCFLDVCLKTHDVFAPAVRTASSP